MERELYVTCQDAYYFASNETAITIAKVPELESPQDESNTKMFFWVPFAASLWFDPVRIVTVGDVGILALYYQNQFNVTKP